MDGSPWSQHVRAWLVATDPWFAKSPCTVSKRVPTRASGDRQERATADSRSDDSDGGGDEDGDDNDDAVLNGEDGPADSDADDAAAAASNDDDEFLLCTESVGGTSTAPKRSAGKKRRRTARVVERRFLLATQICDLTSPFLLAGIHESSVAQEAPTEEAPHASTDNDDATRIVEAKQKLHGLFSDG